MKKEMIMLFLAVGMVLVVFICNGGYKSTESLINETSHFYHDSNKCKDDSNSFCTHLPLIEIDTNNQAIPGEKRDGTTILGNVKIVDNKNNGNHLTDKSDLQTKANIRYRGNSSMEYDKKGYLLKFVHEDGSENHEKVLGMGRHDEWVLHGPFLDKTLLRNYLWYHVSGKIMGYAPDARFCELIVNGKYQGVYVLVESPTRGDESRMPISKYDKGEDYTSYIVRLDKGSKNPLETVNSFTSYAKKTAMKMDIIYPGKDNLTPELNSYITKDISKFEKTLYSYDYDSKRHGYSKYIDVNSFVDYYIINEFTQNYDAGNMSTYLYKDIKGKFGLYVWDFNSANDNYLPAIDIDEFQFQWNNWYYMLMKDEAFVNRIIQRYHYLRATYLSDEYLNAYIDHIVTYLGPAIDRNFEVWGYTFQPEKGMLEPIERNPQTYEEAIKQLKTHITERGQFLDEHIEVIRQFSHESKVKKFNH